MKNNLITTRQKIVLFVLTLVLIIVAVVQFVLNPMDDKIAQKETELNNLTFEYMDMLSDGINLEQLEAEYEQTIADIQEHIDGLLPITENNELDRLITTLALSNGLQVDRLEISDMSAVTIENYVEIEAEDDGGDAFDEYDDYVAGDPTAFNDDATVLVESPTEIMQTQLSYLFEGNYADLVQFIDSVSQSKALSPTSITFIKDYVDNETGYLQIVVTITAFMVNK